MNMIPLVNKYYVIEGTVVYNWDFTASFQKNAKFIYTNIPRKSEVSLAVEVTVTNDQRC